MIAIERVETIRDELTEAYEHLCQLIDDYADGVEVDGLEYGTVARMRSQVWGALDALPENRPTRRAVVALGQTGTTDGLRALLPDNYRIVEQDIDPETRERIAIVEGEDKLGWTLEDYVLPRLASGLYFATEQKEEGNG